MPDSTRVPAMNSLLLATLVLGISHTLLAAEPPTDSCNRLLPAEHRMTAEGIGYGQGVFQHGGKVYLYGDGETGVIREFEWDVDSPQKLTYTGVEIRLTRNGEDIAPHPTGLTHHPKYGTFLGDTVNQRGTIFAIDWEQAKRDGNLDNAILNMVNDDLASNGTRPEFVEVGGRWLIATSDYGDTDNELRLYDPERLQVVSRASAPGVLVSSESCGAFVQSMEWVDDWDQLALIQNQIAGLRYRLTFTTWNEAGELSYSQPCDLQRPVDELEGWTYLDDGWCLYLSSSLKNNVTFGRIRLPE
ncbi:hypothetical protein [Rubinisphaera margarita]|uniref:hypothetical protein n=1 Tax=Rubinisphaera margarita TaxID=2909586 RepID=UPI001EE92306|nr:hypothetical protein [Rubinisphaera margarita]MCG6158601.1 hypothetical protein [Rubinisphaera margarita]